MDEEEEEAAVVVKVEEEEEEACENIWLNTDDEEISVAALLSRLFDLNWNGFFAVASAVPEDKIKMKMKNWNEHYEMEIVLSKEH